MKAERSAPANAGFGDWPLMDALSALTSREVNPARPSMVGARSIELVGWVRILISSGLALTRGEETTMGILLISS